MRVRKRFDFFDKVRRAEIMNYFVVPYLVFGTMQFAVEERNGSILKFCDTRKEAVDFITTISV